MHMASNIRGNNICVDIELDVVHDVLVGIVSDHNLHIEACTHTHKHIEIERGSRKTKPE